MYIYPGRYVEFRRAYHERDASDDNDTRDSIKGACVLTTVTVAFTSHNSDPRPVMPLDNVSEVGPSSPGRTAGSPLTVPSSTSPTPEPRNRTPEPNFWVELRHATAEERDYEGFHLNLIKIVAECLEGSREFYYALLGDEKYHKVYSFLACNLVDLDPSTDALAILDQGESCQRRISGPVG